MLVDTMGDGGGVICLGSGAVRTREAGRLLRYPGIVVRPGFGLADVALRESWVVFLLLE